MFFFAGLSGSNYHFQTGNLLAQLDETIIRTQESQESGASDNYHLMEFQAPITFLNLPCYETKQSLDF